MEKIAIVRLSIRDIFSVPINAEMNIIKIKKMKNEKALTNQLKIMSNRKIMVRACILKCKEYIVIDPTDPNNQRLISLFEAKHFEHPIITIALSEVESYCKNVGDVFLSRLRFEK